MARLGFRDDGDRAQDDAAAYRRDWLIAHGYLPDPIPRPPRGTYHFCGCTGKWALTSRAACPHCKIAAPVEGR